MVENGELVGGFNLPLWKMMEFVSDDEIPNFSWNIKSMFQSPPTRWGFLLRHIWWPRKASFFWPHQLELIPPADDHIHGETSYLLVGETVEKLGKTKNNRIFFKGFPIFHHHHHHPHYPHYPPTHTLGPLAVFFLTNHPPATCWVSLVWITLMSHQPFQDLAELCEIWRDMERYGDTKPQWGPQKIR